MRRRCPECNQMVGSLRRCCSGEAIPLIGHAWGERMLGILSDGWMDQSAYERLRKFRQLGPCPIPVSEAARVYSACRLNFTAQETVWLWSSGIFAMGRDGNLGTFNPPPETRQMMRGDIELRDWVFASLSQTDAMVLDLRRSARHARLALDRDLDDNETLTFDFVSRWFKTLEYGFAITRAGNPMSRITLVIPEELRGDSGCESELERVAAPWLPLFARSYSIHNTVDDSLAALINDAEPTTFSHTRTRLESNRLFLVDLGGGICRRLVESLPIDRDGDQGNKPESAKPMAPIPMPPPDWQGPLRVRFGINRQVSVHFLDLSTQYADQRRREPLAVIVGIGSHHPYSERTLCELLRLELDSKISVRLLLTDEYSDATLQNWCQEAFHAPLSRWSPAQGATPVISAISNARRISV
jgi:hypothetical protein